MNYIIIMIFVAAFSLWTPAIYGQISPSVTRQETTDLNSVLQTISQLQKSGQCNPEDILTVFDNDETLFYPNHKEFTEAMELVLSSEDKGRSCKRREFIDLPTPHQWVFSDTYSIYDDTDPSSKRLIKKSTKIIGVPKITYTQSDISDILEDIKKISPVMALTARYSFIEETTHQQLKFLRFNFEHQPLAKFIPTFQWDQFITIKNPSLGHESFEKLLKQKGMDLTFYVHHSLLQFDPTSGKYNFKFNVHFDLSNQEFVREFTLGKKKDLIFLPTEFTFALASPNFSTYYLGAALPQHQGTITLHPITFSQNIMSSSNANKGILLRSLLQLSKRSPHIQCLFFVDDSLARIQQMEEAFAQQHIKLYTFWYRKVESLTRDISR
jgi:hypothetical protein